MDTNPLDPLVARVDDLTASIAARRTVDLACRRGCSACCHVQLTITPLEADRVRAALRALPSDRRDGLRGRARELRTAGPLDSAEACVMLGEHGDCAIYSARPLVCRTQGHALRYPKGSLSETAIFAEVEGGELTWCPLNYVERAPRSEDVLEAERIDALLGRTCIDAGTNPLERVELVDLALEDG